MGTLHYLLNKLSNSPESTPVSLQQWASQVLDLYESFESLITPLDQLLLGITLLVQSGFGQLDDSQRLLATRLMPWLDGSPLQQPVRDILQRLRDGEAVAPNEVPEAPRSTDNESDGTDILGQQGSLGPLDDEDSDELDRIPTLPAELQVDTALRLAGGISPELLVDGHIPDLLLKLFRMMLALDAQSPSLIADKVAEARACPLAGTQALLSMLDGAWQWYDDNAEVPAHITAPAGIVKPRRAQLAVAYLAQRFARVLDCSDCGLGKTFGGILSLEHSKARTALIVVHPSTHEQVLRDYERAFSSCPSTRVYSSIRKAVRNPEETLGGWRVITVVRSSELGRNGVEKVRSLRKRLGGEIEFVLIDEAHGIKDSDANVTAAAIEATSNARVVVLQTGTPLINNFTEVKQLLSVVSDPERWKPVLDRVDGRATIGNALLLRDCFADVSVRVRNEEPLPSPQVHRVNADGADDELNSLVFSRLVDLYRGGSSRVNASSLESVVFDIKEQWATEFIAGKVAEGHQVLASVGPWVGTRLPALVSALRKRGLRVATYCGEVDRAERDAVVTAVQRKELDVVVANTTGAVGVDGFQGDREFALPGRISCFVEVVSHWTPAIRDQHHRRVVRTRGKNGVVEPVELHTVQVWASLPDPDNEGETVLRSLEAHRHSVLRRKEVLFNAVVEGQVPAGLFRHGIDEELFRAGGELTAARDWISPEAWQ